MSDTTYLYGINKGSNQGNVVVTSPGPALQANDIEVNVDMDVGIGKGEVLLRLRDIMHYIESHPWPPAAT